MKLILTLENKSEFFESQKSLIHALSIVSGAIIFTAGTVVQLINPSSSIGFTVRMFFVSMFFLTAYISKKKNISAYASEVLLATTGASLLIKMLMQYYYSGLSPVHIIGAILIIVGLSGVFINKSSLMIVALPAFAFIFYTSLFPPEGAAYPIGISYVFLVSASVVGYFLTWQKFFLINKSVAQEVHKNTVISNLHEGVILRDTHGKTLALNQAMCQIMGLTQEELINKSDTDPFWNFLKMDGLTPLAFEDRPHNVARRTGKMVRDFPVIFKRPDHSVVQLELTATPIMSNQDSQQVESVLVTFRDVTELRKAQGVIENQKLHMLAHSKLTSLGEMASGIAHEINNPLTIILGRAGQTQKMIELGKMGNQEIIQNLEKITATTLRISKIVKSMRSLSRDNENDEYQKSNLKEIIEDVINVSSDYIKKNDINIELNIPPHIEIECNPGLMSQVFVNLTSNSIDAIKGQTDRRWIRVEAKIENDRVITSFYDSGPGIPTSIKDKIMLPFFTTKEAGKGTGIGLSLCRTIVENHNGLFFIDESAKNTCFVVSIPVNQAASHRLKNAA